jgi:hypothetical protein
VSGRALVPVFIVGIIVLGVLVAMIINKIKRRNPQLKADKRNTELIHDANRIFSQILDPTGNVDTTSFLIEDHKLLIKNWKQNYRKVNGFE